METVKYYLFVTRLAWSLLTELTGIVLKLSIGTKLFVTTFLILGVLFAIQLIPFYLIPRKQAAIEIQLIKDRQTAETELVKWEALASISPNRVAFLNLEKLHRYLGENEKALEYRLRAFQLDPNDAEFTEDADVLQQILTASPSASLQQF
jgi:hypothetical protein